MPRILKSYLISFAIIGLILLIVHVIDLYLHEKKDAKTPNKPATTIPLPNAHNP